MRQDSAAALAARIQRELHLNAVVPRHGEVVVVDAGTAAQAAIKAPAPSPEHGEPARAGGRAVARRACRG